MVQQITKWRFSLLHIVLFLATRRGCRFFQAMKHLLPDARFTVFSFREDPWEPPFLDDLRTRVTLAGGEFFEACNPASPDLQTFWASARVDLLFAVSWRYVIAPQIYQRARQGAFAFHDSMLPEYRGFAPTVWSVINDRDYTGVSLFWMAEQFDAGDLVDQERVSFGPDEVIADILERVSDTYLVVLERCMPAIVKGTAARSVQDHSLASYTCKRLPSDNGIDWTWPSRRIYNLIRAVSKPYPGAFTTVGARRLYIWDARPQAAACRYVGVIAGRVVNIGPSGVSVLAGDGVALVLTRVQLEGADVVHAAEVLTRLNQTLGNGGLV